MEKLVMETLFVAADTRTPQLEFDWASGHFVMRGESYPEDVRKFYDEPIQKFREWLATSPGVAICFEFDLIYFNSSSAKVLMDLFGMIDTAASTGRVATIVWHHVGDDDNSRELAQEFALELKCAKFELCEEIG